MNQSHHHQILKHNFGGFLRVFFFLHVGQYSKFESKTAKPGLLLRVFFKFIRQTSSCTGFIFKQSSKLVSVNFVGHRWFGLVFAYTHSRIYKKIKPKIISSLLGKPLSISTVFCKLFAAAS